MLLFANSIVLFSALILLLTGVLLVNYFRLRKLNSSKENEIQKRSTQLKEQFLANMSHEFRTPLNAIIGMTRLLREKEPRPDQLKYLEAISSASENLRVIINDILDVSKIESGSIRLEQLPFEIRNVMKSVHDVFQLSADEKKIVYEVYFDEQIPPILIGDSMRLIQILNNVIGNAIKFTDQGKVSVKCNRIYDNRSDNNKIWLEFVVQDTGIGMKDETIERIFESFKQESGGATRKHGGTGLGLSITQKLIDLYNGSVSVQSKTGKGSMFRIEIPFAVFEDHDLGVDAGDASASIRQAMKGISILLVEDNEFNRIVAIDTLKSELEEVTIDCAVNGLEAVRLCALNEYDVVLMDLHMPELDGYDASRQIRQLPVPYSDVPVIAMTASALQDEIYRCYEAGMNDFITKPFETLVLLKKMLNQIHTRNEMQM